MPLPERVKIDEKKLISNKRMIPAYLSTLAQQDTVLLESILFCINHFQVDCSLMIIRNWEFIFLSLRRGSPLNQVPVKIHWRGKETCFFFSVFAERNLANRSPSFCVFQIKHEGVDAYSFHTLSLVLNFSNNSRNFEA